MNTLTLLLSLAVAQAPEPVYNLATLSPGAAQSLNLRGAKFRVALDSLPDQEGVFILYDCKSVDAVARTAWFLGSDQDWQDVMTVRATLRIIRHKPSVGADGRRYPGFVEYRLTNAVAVQP